ncbi:MAG TPA: hypothetical protein VFE57_12390 [Cyclobacteriaceae bacterium]|nr:hypothetical protein [Cyclobacteriaceae bacterium]
MLPSLLTFYGLFLITCGIVSVIFIGMKAKTALMSGGMSGALSLFIAYLVSANTQGAVWAGLILSLGLFIVFAWRSTKTLFKIFELLASPDKEELNGKGIAFLIISLMAVVSIFVFTLQVVQL